MSHEHHHHHTATVGDHLNRAFLWGIGLNVAFVAAEATAGILFGSLGLLSDAGHNLSDVISLVLALIAFRLSKVRPTESYTYGYKKSTVLVSLLNAIILLVAVGFIIADRRRGNRMGSRYRYLHQWTHGLALFQRPGSRPECKRSIPAHGRRYARKCRRTSLGHHHCTYRLVYYRPYYRTGYCRNHSHLHMGLAP